MNKPVSISIREISAAAKGSVAKAIEQNSKAFSKPTGRVGFFPPRHWLGFVMDNSDHGKVSLADAQKLATEVHHGIAAAIPAMQGGKAGSIFVDGHLTIGFVPPIEIGLIEE